MSACMVSRMTGTRAATSAQLTISFAPVEERNAKDENDENDSSDIRFQRKTVTQIAMSAQ